MRKIVLIFVTGCILAACVTEEKPRTAAPEKKQPPKADTVVTILPAKKNPSSDFITDKNVKERLLAYGKENPETIVRIRTSLGTMVIRLFKDTPLHRANFIMLAKKGFLDSTVFTRVHSNFIAQGGSAYNKEKANERNEIGYYTVPAEITSHHFHKQGAVGAARSYDDNPDKRSDRSAFYFVEGSRFNDMTLNKYEMDNHYRYTAKQRAYYLENPGAAHIDGEHTVFGEVIEGLEVISKLTSVATDSRDWPLDDLFIEKVEVLR